MSSVNEAKQKFLERTRQELNRAERYCLFLSVVMIDFNDLARAMANRNFPDKINLEAVFERIENGVRDNLRRSDVVSSVDRNRIGVLLVETSKSGVGVAVRRIESFVRDFIKGEFNLPFEPTIDSQSASYPEEAEKITDLTTQFQNSFSGVRR